MPRTGPARERGAMTTRRLGVLLSAWSLGFACVHVAWALGWRGGVPAGADPIAQRPVFLAYDLLAGLLMYAAALVALRLAVGRGSALLVRATVVGSVVALARGVPALAWDVATGHLGGVAVAADAWFVLAGVGGLLLVRSLPVSAHPAIV